MSKNLTAQLESLRPDVEREAQPLFSPAYIRYAMYLLLGIYVVNFLDRQVVNILAEPIKREFGLADWQLGLMSGFAFSVFFTTLGFPIARLAERKNRAAIIGVSVAVWSGLTALCGMAQTFAQLVALRLGVGVGEAGCAPPSHALIADLVPKERRASALAFYAMGVPIGSLLGAVLGGLIAGAWGWRAAFLVVGMPGLLFSMLAFTTLREPRRLVRETAAHAAADAVSFAEAMRYLARRRTFWLLTLGAAIQTCTSLGSAPFIPSFFLRNHSAEIVTLSSSLGALLGVRLKSIAFLGLALGLANGIGAAAGAWGGGLLADRLAARDARAIMIAPTIASVLTVPMALLAFSVDPAGLSLCFLAINFFLGSLWLGPVFSSGQSLVPPQMRATAAATLLFTINLIGLGLGPLAVGVTSDLFNRALGLGPAQGVRWALMSCVVLAMPAAVLFWRARRSIREELVS